jgi:DNA-3-methyladenine glycosylase II
MNIPMPRGFSVEWMLNHIRSSSYGVPYRFVDTHVLRRPLWLNGAPVVVEFDLSQVGTMQLRILSSHGHAARSTRLNTARRDDLGAQARFVWGLDDDAEACYAAMSSDPHMALLLKRFGSLRMMRAPDLYEALLVTVIGQQVSVQAAQSVRRRLIRSIGTSVVASTSSGSEDYCLYPSPLQLIEAGESALRGHGVSRQKVAYLLEIAERAAAGELDPAIFAALSDEEAIAHLCDIKGVGRWTAEIALMRGLGRTDVFPAGDLGLQAAVRELWGMKERPSENVLRGIAERWRGWRSYAAFYLWMTLQCRAL